MHNHIYKSKVTQNHRLELQGRHLRCIKNEQQSNTKTSERIPGEELGVWSALSHLGGSAVAALLKALLNITSWRECSSCSLLWISCSILDETKQEDTHQAKTCSATKDFWLRQTMVTTGLHPRRKFISYSPGRWGCQVLQCTHSQRHQKAPSALLSV